MRNLKKILALVLALVMSLSLMATAGAADNSAAANSETISAEYQTAKDVLSALGIFKGYEDGTFKPKQSITRAEVATILYRMVTGDVASARSDIYGDMQQSTFTDLAGANWARGYINYCANAKLIVGVGGNKFQPSANITGYATLAMVLRALGYDKNGEFQGTGWEIRTASTARELGILNNVNAAEDLGKPATREMVAEILFRAMLCEKVQYNALTQDYTKTGETLGYAVFSLEAVQGVVVANQYADIRRHDDGTGYTSPAAKGTTVLRTEDGKDRIIDTESYLNDLGETRVAYTVEKDNLRDTYENLKKIDLENPGVDDITYDGFEAKSSTGARADKDTQYFINFGEEYTDVKTAIKISYEARVIADTISNRTKAGAIKAFCDKFNLDSTVVVEGNQLTVTNSYTGSYQWRIVYTPKTDADVFNTPAGDRYVTHHIYSIVTKNGEMFYRVEIQPNTLLNAADKVMIPAIFNTANLNPENSTQLVVDGQVFKGTQSLYDYSDWKAYEDFAAECLTQKVQDTKVDSNSLGYWLKVIDNNHDGYTDWVFQTRYTVASVSAMTDGVPTLETASWSGHADDLNNLSNASSTVAEDEGLEVGTVVNYAVIDGVARAWKAETVDARVESINRTAATVTTADGTTYKESAVHEHSARTDIDSGVINMAGKTAYILYMDRSGENMAAFSQNITGKFTLLTDGWSHVQKNGVEYAVKAWDQDTQAFVQYDITSGGNMFVDVSGSDNNWNRIRTFDPLNCNNIDHASADESGIHTIMAYMETDGENATLMPVDMIYDTQRIEGLRPINMFDTGTQIPDASTNNRGDIWYSGVDGTFLPNRPNDWNGVYGHDGTQDVEIRALSNTIYLYVYRTWYGTTSTMAVRQFTGYKDGSDWMNLRTNQQRHDDYVEDVYVVGTKAWHTDTTGNTGNEYYVADYVVVELNDNFYRDLNTDHEQVFVYDFENVINSVNLEKVKAINAKGEDVELTIDLSRSSRVYYDGGVKGREPAPGLFYLWQTDTADVWAISRMSHEDIRNAGCYDVGTVGYSWFTSGHNYANIYNWYSNDNDCHWTGCVGDHANPDVYPGTTLMTAGALAENRYNTDSSAYYTLSYATGSYGKNATLTKSVASVVLDEDAPDLGNGGTNEVLVRYRTNAANQNEIVYAISFAHVERTSSGVEENYAQEVYRGVLMDADPANWETYLNGVNRELANYAEELKEQYPDKIPAIEAALADAKEQVNNVPEGRWDDLWNLRDALREALKDAAENGENPEVKYDVIIDETFENGTVEADVATAAEGDVVTLTAIPDEGYVVESITVATEDGTEIEVVDNAFTMPAQNVTVYAAFVEKGDDVTVTFAPATGTETEFNSVELTALEDQTVAEGADVAPVPGDNIPAAEDVTATMSGLRIALALLKVEDPSAATEDDVWTMDVYTDPVEIPAEDGMTVYYYYYVVEIDETPDDPDDPVDPVDPIDPGEDDGDDIIVVHSASLDPMSGIQTLGLFPDPIDTYCTWMLVKNAVENVYLDDAYEVTNGPKQYTEGMEDGPAKAPSKTVLAAAEKYSKTRTLWFVEYKMANGGAFVEPVPSATPPEAKVTVTVTGENVTVEPAGTAFAVGTELTISAAEGYTITAAKASVGEVTIAEDKLTATYTVPASEEEITIEVTTAVVESEELAKAKTDAKAELDGWAASAKGYTSDDLVKANIDEALKAEKAKIDAAEDVEAVKALVQPGKDAITAALNREPTAAERQAAANEKLDAYAKYVKEALELDATKDAAKIKAIDDAVTAQKAEIAKATTQTAIDNALVASYSAVNRAAGTTLAGLQGIANNKLQAYAKNFITTAGTAADTGVQNAVQNVVNAAKNKIIATTEETVGTIPTVVADAQKAIDGLKTLIEDKTAAKAEAQTVALNATAGDLRDDQKAEIKAELTKATDAIKAATTSDEAKKALESFKTKVDEIIKDSGANVGTDGNVEIEVYVAKDSAGTDVTLTKTALETALKEKLGKEYIITAGYNEETGAITTGIKAFNKETNKVVDVTVKKYRKVMIGDSTEMVAKMFLPSEAGSVDIANFPKGTYIAKVADAGASLTAAGFDATSGTLTVPTGSQSSDLVLYPAVKVNYVSPFVAGTVKVSASSTGTKYDVTSGNVVKTGAILTLSSVAATSTPNTMWELKVANVDGSLLSKPVKGLYESAVENSDKTPANQTVTVSGTKPISISVAAGREVEIDGHNLGVVATADLAKVSIKGEGVTAGKYISVSASKITEETEGNLIDATGDFIDLSANVTPEKGKITLVRAVKVTADSTALSGGTVTAERGTVKNVSINLGTDTWVAVDAKVIVAGVTPAAGLDIIAKYTPNSNAKETSLKLTPVTANGATTYEMSAAQLATVNLDGFTIVKTEKVTASNLNLDLKTSPLVVTSDGFAAGAGDGGASGKAIEKQTSTLNGYGVAATYAYELNGTTYASAAKLPELKGGETIKVTVTYTALPGYVIDAKPTLQIDGTNVTDGSCDLADGVVTIKFTVHISGSAADTAKEAANKALDEYALKVKAFAAVVNNAECKDDIDDTVTKGKNTIANCATDSAVDDAKDDIILVIDKLAARAAVKKLFDDKQVAPDHADAATAKDALLAEMADVGKDAAALAVVYDAATGALKDVTLVNDLKLAIEKIAAKAEIAAYKATEIAAASTGRQSAVADLKSDFDTNVAAKTTIDDITTLIGTTKAAIDDALLGLDDLTVADVGNDGTLPTVTAVAGGTVTLYLSKTTTKPDSGEWNNQTTADTVAAAFDAVAGEKLTSAADDKYLVAVEIKDGKLVAFGVTENAISVTA